MTAPGTLSGAVEPEEIEIDALLDVVYRCYGFDFRGYSRASIRRRLWHRADAEGVATISSLQDRLVHDRSCMERLLLDLSISVTAMFRDPSFFVAFRRKVVPLLMAYPFVRIWNAGCSTGEETYSLAIILEEEGLGDRVRIYATDINEAVIAKAKGGIFPLDKMKPYTEHYQASGGKRAFSEYYVAGYRGAQFDRHLVRNVVFARHNLVSDASFNDFHFVLCRNVLIYFGEALQERVHRLFYESLVPLGVLALGPKESVALTGNAAGYEILDAQERLFRKVPRP